MNLGYKIIAVGFDGTLCTNKWPEIGDPNYPLIEYLKKQQNLGNKVILWTCRTGELLDKAVKWCSIHDLYFDAVNANIPEVYLKMNGDSRKIFAHEYIDDRAVTLDSVANTVLDDKLKHLSDSISDSCSAIQVARRTLLNFSRRAAADSDRFIDICKLEEVSGHSVKELIELFQSKERIDIL